MKKLLLGICSVLISIIVAGQGLHGKITDSVTGQPVPSATVEVLHHASIITDENGQFNFGKLGTGSYQLRISSVGYRSSSATVQYEGRAVDFRLQRVNLLMQPVEVKATRAGDRAPFTKTNIGKAEIEEGNLAQDLPFLLNQTPSVIVNSDAGNGVGYTGIRIRGSDATRINMTINGIPYNDAESQGLFFVNLPDLASSVNSIQIQRGIGTSSNGAGAFGATMNFSTNEVNISPYAELNNSAGSFDTWKHTIKAGSGLLSDHFTIDARLSRISSDSYIDRASTDLRSFYVSGAYLSDKSSLRLNVFSGTEKTYQAWNGVSQADLKDNRTVNYAGMERPGSPYDNETDNYQQDHYQLFFNHQFSDRLLFNTAFFFTRGKGYYEQYKAEEAYEDYGLDPFVSGLDTMYQTDLIRQLWLDNKFYGQIISLNYKTAADELTIGGGWNKYEGKHYGKIIWATAGIPDNYKWYDLPADKTDLNGYLKYQRKIAKSIEVFGDLQVRNVQYNLNGFRDNPGIMINNNYTFFNPKLGLSYFNGPVHVYASYSQASKEPNRDDFEAGATNQPKPEKMQDIEAGLEWRKTAYRFGATAFYMYYKDQLVLTGQVNDVGAYTRTNIPESYRVGLELQGSWQPNRFVNLAGNLTLSKNRINDFTEYFDDYDLGGQKSIHHGNTDISFSPDIIAGFTAEFMPFKNFTLALPAKYVGRQYLDNTSDASRSLDDFYVQDLRMSYNLQNLLINRINLTLQVNNIFNRTYEPNGYTYSYVYGGETVTENYYYPMAGTNFMFAVNLRF